jgi:hypothetical protein
MYSEEKSAAVATAQFISLALFLGLVALVNGNFRDVVVATCNHNRSNLQSRHFPTRIKCNYKFTSTRINCK